MKTYPMEYRIITSTDPSEFQRMVSNQILLGWKPMGSHSVITTNTTDHANRVYYNNEYSISLVKEKDLDVVESVLQTIRKDAEMALSGEWDCTTHEGIESFNDQIELIDKALYILK